MSKNYDELKSLTKELLRFAAYDFHKIKDRFSDDYKTTFYKAVNFIKRDEPTFNPFDDSSGRSPNKNTYAEITERIERSIKWMDGTHDKPKHVNEIKLSGDDAWTTQFNKCSDLYAKAFDVALTEEQRTNAWNEFVQQRQMLEMGMFNE